MTTFVYTDSKQFFGSSVLSAAHYNSRSKHLTVRLNNDVVAGYENVSEGVWNNFKSEDTFPTGSAGRFWNTMIKENFVGFDTADLDEWIDTLGEASDRAEYGYADEDYFNPTPSESHVEITEAAPDEAPEIDQPSALRPEDFPEGTPSRAAYEFVEQGGVKDVTAGSDLGQRSYEITFEVVSVETKTAVVYADNDVAAEQDFLRDFDEVKITDVRRRF